MSDAPERLYRADWIVGNHMAADINIWSGPSTEYIRADLVAAKDARITELERQLAAVPEIERHDLVSYDEGEYGMDTYLAPRADGEWVRFEDHQAAMAVKERQLAEARDVALDEAADRIERLFIGRDNLSTLDRASQTIRAMKGRKP